MLLRRCVALISPCQCYQVSALLLSCWCHQVNIVVVALMPCRCRPAASPLLSRWCRRAHFFLFAIRIGKIIILDPGFLVQVWPSISGIEYPFYTPFSRSLIHIYPKDNNWNGGGVLALDLPSEMLPFNPVLPQVSFWRHLFMFPSLRGTWFLLSINRNRNRNRTT